MSAGKIFVTALVAFVAVGTYFAVLPVPEELPNPWILRGMAFTTFLLAPLPNAWRCYVLKTIKGDQLDMGSRLINDTEFDGVPVRVSQPLVEPKAALPAIVYLHGGGWINSKADFYYSNFNKLATRLDNFVIVAVEYRLAPKHVFPAATDDCTNAVVWLLRHAKDYHVDFRRVAVIGDSAGGNLAAAVSQRLSFDAKYKDLSKLKLQVLIYPCLQALDFNLPSYQQHGHHLAVPLTKSLIIQCWSLYLQGNDHLVKYFAINNHTSPEAKSSPTADLVSHDLIPSRFKYGDYVPNESRDFGETDIYNGIKATLLNPDFAPLVRKDLRGLPEAYVLTSEFDVLRDDGIMYAKRLEAAGVQVTWKHYDVGIHGMLSDNGAGIFKIEVAEKATNDLVDFLQKML